MKKKFLVASLVMLFPITMISCGGSDDEELMGKWYRVSDFDGVARTDASSFTIGNKGYLTSGYRGPNKDILYDLWEYDMERDSWTQKADFPGTPRYNGVAFVVNEKGYYGTGLDGSKNYYNDFWEYNPTSNSWEEKTSFPGSARFGAVSFGLSGRGYIGCGFDGNFLKDFYSFNPSTNSWEQIVSIGGSKRQDATAFVINNVAYVCLGQNNGDYIYDFWKYDQSSNAWTQLRDIANTSDDDYDDDYAFVRTQAVSFVIDGNAYIACGTSGSLRTDTWKYYPSTDLWEKVSKFKGSIRTSTASFSNGTRGYVVTGGSGTSYYDDIWELKPYEYDDDEY